MIDSIHAHNIDEDNRIIYLHGDLSSDTDPGIDNRCSVKFIKNINYLNSINSEPIEIQMNCIGGEWAAGMGIYDAISHSASRVIAVAYSQLESMSGVIFQAADVRLISKNAHFMLHYGNTGYHGDYKNVHNYLDFEKNNLTPVMIDIYAKCILKGSMSQKFKTKKSASKFIEEKLMNGDWYLTAEQAVDLGFADGILQ